MGLVHWPEVLRGALSLTLRPLALHVGGRSTCNRQAAIRQHPVNGDRFVHDDPLAEIGAQLAHVTLILQELRARSLTTREASELLDHADIQKLTGSAAVNSQMRWLRDRGIPFRAEFVGAATARKRLILTRFHVRQWIERRDTPKNPDLNWDAVR